MTLLFRVIYAAHATGTHHKLALDALRLLEVDDAERWQRVMLKHAKTYLEGSKAPDKEFKDFKNHVLHVGDNYWGGAPEKVESWYHLLVRALAEQKWQEAAWCAGILSHYYTDPIHPFHTGQTEAENAIHRAVEWSISKSYDSLLAEASNAPAPDISTGTGPTWIKDFVIAGAENSNRHYAALIAHYDFQRGVVDPPSGLDPVARQIVGELLVRASFGFARLLDRAITESGAVAPDVSLTVETVLATLAMPAKWITKRLGDAEDRRQVEAMYDELMETGKVEKTLPEDDRMVRDLHAREVLAKRAVTQTAARADRAAVPQRAQGQIAPFAPATVAVKPATVAKPGAPAAVHTVAPVAPRATEAKDRPAVGSVPLISAVREASTGQSAQTSAAVASAIAAATLPPFRAEPPAPVRSAPADAPVAAERVYLAVEDDVEAAPSIGPRMAERLAAVGVATVGDLLAADPGAIAQRLGDSRIKGATILDWQDQARLVCRVPGLRGTHAQLLVGAGLRSPEAIADREAGSVHAAVLRFATSPDGQRLLRDGAPPDLEKVSAWIARAAQARPLAA